jgi:ZIP family zinc transporter
MALPEVVTREQRLSMPLAHAAGYAGPGLVVTGALLIGAATVAGAWLARRHAARRERCFGAAAGALLVIAGLHLLPDAWSAARQAAIPAWAVPAAAIAAFAVTGAAIHRGCACRAERETAGGAGTAGALAAHRLLEGVAVVLAGSLMVTVALAVHALAEGLAAGTLLASAPRRQRVRWLAIMCASPAAGAALAVAWPFPATVQPVMLAVAAGVLGQAARVSLSGAFRQARPVRLAMASPAAATLVAAASTALAVHLAG